MVETRCRHRRSPNDRESTRRCPGFSGYGTFPSCSLVFPKVVDHCTGDEPGRSEHSVCIMHRNLQVSKRLVKNDRLNVDQTLFPYYQFMGICFKSSRESCALYLNRKTKYKNVPVGNPSRNHKREMIIYPVYSGTK